MENNRKKLSESSHCDQDFDMKTDSIYRVEFVATEFLRPNECTSRERIIQLRDKIISEGLWKTPILAETNSLAIMDGHHRTEVAKLLGLAVVPVVLIDYTDSRLDLSARRGDVLVSPEEVIRRSYTGERFPWKTTKHTLNPGVQDTLIPLSSLFGNGNELN